MNLHPRFRPVSTAATPLWLITLLALLQPAPASGGGIVERGSHPQCLQDKGAGEGPAWHPALGLLTSGEGHIFRRSQDKGVSIHLENAGSNGILFDRQGRLVYCDSARRRVVRVEARGAVTVLADRFDGHRFNTPNDLTLDSKDRLYFSDPRYGPRDDMEMKDAAGATVEGVYRIDPDGQVRRVLGREVDRANGVAVSRDDRYLFVADNNNNTPGGARKLWRFELRADGTVQPGSRRLLFDWKGTRGPDGIKIDSRGRLFVAAGLNRSNPPWETQAAPTAGVYVLSPRGRLLEFIAIPRDETTNCAFGEPDLRTLYVTAGGSLWSVRLQTPGWIPGLDRKPGP